MSTYLQLCQAVRRDCSVTGTLSTVVGQSGMLERVVEWVALSYLQLQNKHNDWRWLRYGWTVNTVADDDTYAYGDCTDITTSSAITRFQEWAIRDRDNPPKCYLQSAGVGTEYWLTYVPWPQFRIVYKKGTQNSAAPQWISTDPQNNIVLGPAPSAVYVVSGEYQRSAQVLSADGDTPEMPSDFHDLIYYGAMEMYAGHTGAQEKLFRVKNERPRLMRALERNQLPEVGVAGPLA